jgi:hypothetical protein
MPYWIRYDGCVHVTLLAISLLVVLSSCGGNSSTFKSKPTGNASDERDQKHCSSHSDCTSGLCRAGRCG